MLYIGKEVQDRMELLGLIVKEVADKTFLEEDVVAAIINNEISLENIEEFDFHCSAAYCTVRRISLQIQKRVRGICCQHP